MNEDSTVALLKVRMINKAERWKRIYVFVAVNWMHACLLVGLALAAAHLAFQQIDANRYADDWNPQALHSLSIAEADALLSRFKVPADWWQLHQPWVGFSEGEYHSPGFNIDRSDPIPVRRTINRSGGEQKITIWLFGGSTTFGWGVPDNQTIASHLSDILSSKYPGQSFEVVNHGHCWYYSSQETQLFHWLLRSGKRAEIAIFLDGLNETFYWSDHAFAPPFSLLDRIAKGLVRRIRFTSGPESPEPPVSEKLRRNIQIYRTNLISANETSEAFNIRPLFFWQPTPFEDGHDNEALAEYWLQLDFALKSEILHPAFVDISRLFAGARRDTTYVDSIHYGDAASRQIAEAMVSEIIERGLVDRLATP